MPNPTIQAIQTVDARFALPPGAGSDALHSNPEYSMAVTRLLTMSRMTGTGIALTLGDGNRLVCEAIELLAQPLIGIGIEDLMTEFGAFSRNLADHPALRWLGPHKGVVHLALASITNACFDLWAKNRGLPLWKLLLELSPEELVRTLDLSYLESVLSEQQAVALLRNHFASREERMDILDQGYPGYDTSVGWISYEDAMLHEMTQRALDQGFRGFKLKVGSQEESRDVRRASLLRDAIGDAGMLMLDANQRWSLASAIRMGRVLAEFNPLWIEEPTHPDDIQSHATLARELAPIKIACGEHIPNRVLFRNFIGSGAVHFVQADCTRLAGVSEFLTVSLLAKTFGIPVVPHVGDMGQIHQHLVLFNHVALDHAPWFLEYIPHLRNHFVFPTEVSGGSYRTPQEPGASTDMKLPAR
jgi:L-fuconate dehydratase